MNKLIISILLSLFALVLAPAVPLFSSHEKASAYTETQMDKEKLFKVVSVVDGDTIKVNVRGKVETVRLLGIDSPETVDPRKSVQCFGNAASDKLKSFFSGKYKYVRLVDDSTQGNRDKYNRLLRYVYLPNSKATFINGEMVKQGYAFSYRQYPTKMLTKFNNFETSARQHNLGLWAACPTATSKVTVAPVKKTPTVTAPKQLPTVAQSAPAQSAPAQTNASGGDKDCKDFATHAVAQAYFTGKGGSPSNNVDRLDGNHDGVACEDLP